MEHKEMKPKDVRNLLLAQRLIQQLERRHFHAFYCPTVAEAVEKLLSLIPDGSSVAWGGSMTLRDMGIPIRLHQRNLQVFDRDFSDNKEELYRQAFLADFYLSSVNAMSEDGVIVNIDGNGNRVAAITYGPKQVIFVVGMNKVTPDVQSAIARARGTAAPINAARFDIKTPCRIDGICHDCHSPESICNYIHILRNSHPAGRHMVVLVGEDLGY